MTSRQRLLTAMRCERPDRVPVAPFGLGHLDPDGEAARELIAKTDPFITAGSGGDPILGRGAPVTSRQEGDTTIATLATPKGDLVRRRRRTSVTSATVEFYLKGPEDVERLLSLPYEPPDIDLQRFEEWKERVGEEALVMVGVGNAVCLPASWFSPEDLCLAWAERPDVLRRLTAVAADRINAYVERLCEAGVDAFRIIGGEYVTVQLGPRAFDELITPFDTELVDIMHRHGAVAYYHNHGNMMRWLDGLADLGIDALDPMEAPPWGDADLALARERLAGRTCMVGNLDDMEIIDSLPAADVQAIARERLAAAGPVGFILGGTASGTYTERAARNFIALVEVSEEFGTQR
jgi:hypothetical protein